MDNKACGTVYQMITPAGYGTNDYFVALDARGGYVQGVRFTASHRGVFVHIGAYSYESAIDAGTLEATARVTSLDAVPLVRGKVVAYILALLASLPENSHYVLQRAVYTLCLGADYIRVADRNFSWQPYKGYLEITIVTI